MAPKGRNELVAALAGLITAGRGPLPFHVLEVGAAPVQDHAEPFYALLGLFPGSRITAFEVDAGLCAAQNASARPGLRFHPVALGRATETRPFHVTADPLCSSLYPPNVDLIRQYCHMEAALPGSVTSVDTVRLDDFLAGAGLPPVDFIKIDVQGGELDVFQGGTEALRNVVSLVTEVEFIPQYAGQPLFGDVSGFLDRQGFMFQCFLSFGRRALNPFVIDDPDKGSHFVWADALFSRHILGLDQLADERLLKLAVLATLYGSEDLAWRCLYLVDQRRGTEAAQQFLGLLKFA